MVLGSGQEKCIFQEIGRKKASHRCPLSSALRMRKLRKKVVHLTEIRHSGSDEPESVLGTQENPVRHS